MVNEAVTGSDARTAERALALGYAPPGKQGALRVLFDLDRRLGALAIGREPMIAQMRLTWWYEALRRLDTAPPPAEPLLQAVVAALIDGGLTGAELAEIADGWEMLLDPEPDDDGWRSFASRRGGTLFALAARLLDAAAAASDADRIAAAGAGWALAEVATAAAGRPGRERAGGLAAEYLAPAGGRWPRALRPLGALALIARADLAGTPPASPRRIARLALHRLTGR